LNRILASCLTLGLVLAACAFPQLKPDPPKPVTSEPLPIDRVDRSIFEPGLVESAQPILEGLKGASVYHIEFTIQDDLAQVSGQEVIRYTNMEDVDLDEVQLRLFPNILGGEMEISDPSVDGKGVTPRFSLQDSLLTLPLSPPLEPGKSVTLTLGFAVSVPETLEMNYGVLAYAQNVLALAHAYPMIAVFDDEDWNAEIPSQSGDVTYADMSFFVVKVTAPDELTLVATGREVERTESARTQTVTYAAGPVRDFYLAASPDYQLFTRQAGDITIRFYAPSHLAEGALAGLETAARSIEDFTRHYAPYPYTELDLVSTPTLALGIEYPGMIAITDRIISPDNPYFEATLAHEVAHQWFYNLVGNDQLDDPWLDEALAQFATLQYFTDEYGQGGASGFRASLTGRWERVDDGDLPIGLPVAAYSDLEYGAIVYGRGPLFFEALREEMGSEVFDPFIREYVEIYAWGIATPEALQRLAETHCACQLDGLFEEWVYR
jgi:aminopeptidase N